MMTHSRNLPILWITGVIAISLVLLASTILGVAPLNLRDENNLAALFSGLLLLLIALHAYDGVAANRRDQPPLARAWAVVCLVFVLLSFDEVGSLHERLPADSHGQYWLWVLPFALMFVAMGLYAVFHLLRSERYRRPALLMFSGFVLFLLVALQEELEWRLNWPGGLKPLRAAIEEGTELLGMTLILIASMHNTQGLLSPPGKVRFPVLEAVHRWRWPVLVGGLVLTPLIAWWTTGLQKNQWNHGLPAVWPAAAIFFLAGVAALRPALTAPRHARWTQWALTAACGFGCATAALEPGQGKPLLPLAGLAIGLATLWLIDGRYPRRAVAAAIGLLIVCFAVASLLPRGEWVDLTVMSYVALAGYAVLGAPLIADKPAAD
jgi:hypothetical protein